MHLLYLRNSNSVLSHQGRARAGRGKVGISHHDYSCTSWDLLGDSHEERRRHWPEALHTQAGSSSTSRRESP
ncbi:uncharacterized protein M421DRAFT_424588 [Didymella exigua CBS 183.55]|uniref:Uncharacterized protein n=1 Tax=Didymella exigua CBS 183.55 TaxID=1150837 RepID=A0A6A5RGF5_9PLEO|nr:uncharacterized protein M421DRAFT_424588 [Didymella exigua CBS 183.55]KAF1924707.1 hypothetical protein M421DRAFT_424588 [Didymella exigua CBS 183.55]